MYNTQLETFIKVADSGSFSKAGEELFVTPTAVIKQINSLESRLDLKLFIRTHRGLKLTEAGKSLYKDAKYIVKYSKKAVEKARKVEEKSENTVRVGTSLMTPEKKLMDIWLKIRNEYPDIKLKIVPFENTPERVKEILNNMGKEIDIIVSIHDDSLLGTKNYATTKLYDLSLCAFVSVNHPLASKERLDIKDLYNENVMMIHRGWNTKMDELRDTMEKNHSEINIIDFDFFSLEIFNKCENSNNILILPTNYYDTHPLLKLISADWDYSIPFEMIHSSKPTKVVQKFIDAIKKKIGNE